jgi:hypothetical protein
MHSPVLCCFRKPTYDELALKLVMHELLKAAGCTRGKVLLRCCYRCC